MSVTERDSKESRDRRAGRLILVGGGAYLFALQLANPHLVLPWIASNLGVAPVLIALIVPAVQVGQILGQLLLGPKLANLRRRKIAMQVAQLGLALAIGSAALAAVTLPPQLAGTTIISCAAIFGACWGLYIIAFQDLVAKTIGRNRRGALLAQRAMIGGTLTLAATATLHIFAPEFANKHEFLLWSAVGLWAFAAVSDGFIDEQPRSPRERRTAVSELKRGFALIREHHWFADFIVGRIVLLTVELAIPFYTIYITSLRDPTAKDLSLFVFAMSLGMIVGGQVWGRMTSSRPHLVISLGAWIMALAGFVTLIIDQVAQLHVPYYHAATFLFLAMGRQGVIQGRQMYLSIRTPENDRPIYISIADALMSTIGIGIALFLGWAAQLTDIFNPLLALIALNMTAAVYALEVFRDCGDEPENSPVT